MQNGLLPQLDLPIHTGDWYFIMALASVLLFVIVKWLNPRYISRLIQATLSNYEAHRLITDKNIRMQQALIMLIVLSIMTLSLFWIIQLAAIPKQTGEFPSFFYFMKVVVVVSTLMAARLLSVRLFGALFKVRELSRKLNQIWIVQIHFLGITLGCVAVLIPYIPYIGYEMTTIGGYVLIVIWLIYNIIRQLQILAQNCISLFYRILYLCAFEILPWWWIIETAIKGWSE